MPTVLPGVATGDTIDPAWGNSMRAKIQDPPGTDPHVNFAQVFNVKNYGAKGDGVTDDRTALFDADAAVPSTGGDIYLPPGTYLVNSNLTFSAKSRLLFANGAMLKVATGVTVTINGPLEAPLSEVFDLVGTGGVAFGTGSLTHNKN